MEKVLREKELEKELESLPDWTITENDLEVEEFDDNEFVCCWGMIYTHPCSQSANDKLTLIHHDDDCETHKDGDTDDIGKSGEWFEVDDGYRWDTINDPQPVIDAFVAKIQKQLDKRREEIVDELASIREPVADDSDWD